MSVSSLPVPLYFVPLSIARCVSDRSPSVTERIGKGWCFVFAVNSTHVPSRRFANVTLYQNFTFLVDQNYRRRRHRACHIPYR